MSSQNSSAPAHDDLVSAPSRQPSTRNPFAQSANVTVSVPETVEIRLVDATVLSDYETWTFLASILSSTVVGFVVAYLQAPEAPSAVALLAAGIVFAILLLVCGITAVSKRRQLRKKQRSLTFRLGEHVPD